MIKALRGSVRQLTAHFAGLLEREERAFLLYAPPEPYRSWNGIRALLVTLTDRFGERRVEEVLGRHRAAASFVLPRFAEELAPEERRQRRYLAARLDSHLSHNWYMQRPLSAAWARLLLEILDGEPALLAVPVLNHLDNQSVGVLKSLYRLFPDRAPSLAIGYDRDARSPQLDAQGLYWHPEPLDFQKIVFGIQQFYGVALTDLDGDADDGAEIPAIDTEPLGAHPEERAAAALARCAGPPDEAVARQVVQAVRVAFESFGYRQALRLGMELLERRPRLADEDAAELHGILGLAAHNRQFHSRGNLPLAELIHRHLRRALEVERRPAERCALLYRMAVTVGRRLKQTEEAMAWTERALAAAGDGLLPVEAAYQRAWALNIRGYLEMLRGHGDEADRSCEEAYALVAAQGPLLEPLGGAQRQQWERELAISRAVLISNLSALATTRGDLRRYETWRRKGCEEEQSIPDLDRYKALDWVTLYRQRHEVRSALSWALRGAELSRLDHEALWEYYYLLQAADLHYRVGDARSSHATFEQLRQLRATFGNPDTLQSVELASIHAALRSGQARQACEVLRRGLAGARGATLEGRAELLAGLGLARAATGDAAEAERRIGEAVDLAVDHGGRDLLLLVALLAGRACSALGRIEEARDAYRRALDIAAAESAEPAAAAARLEALLGADGDGPAVPERSAHCVALLPEALDDAEIWWQLPTLLERLAAAPPPAQGADGAAEPLAVLLRAARQRDDCAAPLGRWLATLPAEQRRALEGAALDDAQE